jgi:hypothetical protein
VVRMFCQSEGWEEYSCGHLQDMIDLQRSKLNWQHGQQATLRHQRCDKYPGGPFLMIVTAGKSLRVSLKTANVRGSWFRRCGSSLSVCIVVSKSWPNTSSCSLRTLASTSGCVDRR